MKKYAVIETGGKQYKVAESSIIEIEKLAEDLDKQISLDKVIFYADGGSYQIGKPYLSNINITAKVVGQIKGKKIRVMKFKAKAKYRRVTGHRQSLTKVQILKIEPKSDKKKEDKTESSEK